jgi:hypothetical protein
MQSRELEWAYGETQTEPELNSAFMLSTNS